MTEKILNFVWMPSSHRDGMCIEGKSYCAEKRKTTEATKERSECSNKSDFLTYFLRSTTQHLSSFFLHICRLIERTVVVYRQRRGRGGKNFQRQKGVRAYDGVWSVRERENLKYSVVFSRCCCCLFFSTPNTVKSARDSIHFSRFHCA